MADSRLILSLLGLQMTSEEPKKLSALEGQASLKNDPFWTDREAFICLPGVSLYFRGREGKIGLLVFVLKNARPCWEVGYKVPSSAG